MKHLMKLFGVLVLFGLMSPSLYAQSLPNREREARPQYEHSQEKIEEMSERIVEELGLSKKQAKKVKAINQKYAEKRRVEMEELRRAMKERKEAIRQEHNSELKRVLKDEQFQKLQEMEAKRDAKMQKRKSDIKMKRQKGMQRRDAARQRNN